MKIKIKYSKLVKALRNSGIGVSNAQIREMKSFDGSIDEYNDFLVKNGFHLIGTPLQFLWNIDWVANEKNGNTTDSTIPKTEENKIDNAGLNQISIA